MMHNDTRLNVLIGCELSGVVRRAFRAAGHNAWSCDIEPAEDKSPFHIQGDVRDVLSDEWDIGIFHPPCTRLCNSGVRWLNKPPAGKTVEQMQNDLRDGADLFAACYNAPIPYVAVENPIMHKHARELLHGLRPTQIIQPWHFGQPAFKATGLFLRNLPTLEPVNMLTPPAPGTYDHKYWSAVHLAPDSKNRARIRSRTFDAIADAMASQWAAYVVNQYLTHGLTPRGEVSMISRS